MPALGLIALAAAALFTGFVISQRRTDPARTNRLEVVVVNVGEGESSVIRTPDGHVVLIGAGPPGQGRRIFETLEELGAHHIDLLILPYPYAEAIGGTVELLSSLRIGTVIESGGPAVNQWQEHIRTECRRRGIRVEIGRAGESILLGGARVSLLAPGAARVLTAPTAANNSLVVRLQWQATHFLFAGGIDRAGEDALLSRGGDLCANWLRIARFGVDTATSAEFLERVSPEISVVSVGQNQNGYPAPGVIARIAAAGSKIYRTDARPDNLYFWSDGARVGIASSP
jgi:competence protein ComEC